MVHAQERPKLIRMTMKRKILLDSILTTLRLKIESIEREFELIACYPNRTEQEKAQLLREKEEECERLKLYSDVLETVASHDRELHLRTFRYQEREWKNEWEIPVALFNQAILSVIFLLRWYQERSIKGKEQKEKQIRFLQELQKFRNAGEIRMNKVDLDQLKNVLDSLVGIPCKTKVENPPNHFEKSGVVLSVALEDPISDGLGSLGAEWQIRFVDDNSYLSIPADSIVTVAYTENGVSIVNAFGVQITIENQRDRMEEERINQEYKVLDNLEDEERFQDLNKYTQ